MSDKNEDKPLHHKRMRDWACPDRIEIEVVPRYKTSGLSGDVWRTSVMATAFFKGEKIAEAHYRDMDAALQRIPVWIADDVTCPLSDQVMALEAKKCDQPGCSEDAISSYLIRDEYSDQGDRLDQSERYHRGERHFCRRHLERGDASREDSDKNYLVAKGPGPSESAMPESDESPARTVTVKVDSIDELAGKVAEMKKRGEL